MDTRTGRIYDSEQMEILEKYLGEGRNAEDIQKYNEMFKSISPEDRPHRIDDLKIMKKELTTYQRKNKKIGRNEPCPCDSGKKFKKCCLQKNAEDN